MIGQKHINEKLNTYSLTQMPRSLLIIGEEGSGKHTVVNEISKTYNLPVRDLTDVLSSEVLQQVEVATDVAIYFIDFNKIPLKEQNVILKTLEEQPTSAYFILICNHKNKVLQTIYNRCQVWDILPYTNQELASICGIENTLGILNILKTPGQLKVYGEYVHSMSIEDMLNRVDFIFTHIGRAYFPNALKLADNLAYGEFDNTKWCSFDIFVKFLIYFIFNKIVEGDTSADWNKLYYLTSSLQNNSYISHVDKKNLYERYLLNVKLIL